MKDTLQKLMVLLRNGALDVSLLYKLLIIVKDRDSEELNQLIKRHEDASLLESDRFKIDDILKSSLPQQRKIEIIFNPDLRDKHSLILEETPEEATLNSNIREQISIAPKLAKYAKFLTKATDSAIKNRETIGLSSDKEIISHILLGDTTGRTEGCGCVVCKNRHKLFLYKKTLSTYKKEKKNLDLLEDVLVKRTTNEDGSLRSLAVDPFEIEFFSRMKPIYTKQSVKISNKRVITTISGKEKTTSNPQVFKIKSDAQLVFSRIKRNKKALVSKINAYDTKIKLFSDSLAKLKNISYIPY